MSELELPFDKYKWVAVQRKQDGKTWMVVIWIEKPFDCHEVVKGLGMTVALALADAEAKLSHDQLNIIYKQFLEMHLEE